MSTNLITDHQFYLDKGLKDLIDLAIKRVKHKWDNVLVIDGDERSGKTTLAKTIAYYYAWKTGKKFDINNVFFDPDDMMDFATTSEEQVLVWDEAAFGGLSSQWHNRVQQKLNTTLMVSGKYRHFYIMIIPSFFRLNKYLALDRSMGLIHVYSPDLLTRGYFTVYNKMQKTWAYNNNKKSETYGRNKSLKGVFRLKNTDKIIDEVAYEAKKDAAIRKFVKNESDKVQVKLKTLQYHVASRLKPKEAAEVAGINTQTIYKWLEFGKKLGLA